MPKKKVEFKPIPKSSELEKESKKKTGKEPYDAAGKSCQEDKPRCKVDLARRNTHRPEREAIMIYEYVEMWLKPAMLDMFLDQQNRKASLRELEELRNDATARMAKALRLGMSPADMASLVEAIISLLSEEIEDFEDVMDLFKGKGSCAEIKRAGYSRSAAEPEETALERTIRQAPPGTIGAGLGTNKSAELPGAELGERFILGKKFRSRLCDIRPARPTYTGSNAEALRDRPIETVTSLLQEALTLASHTDDLDLTNCHEQLCSLEGVLAPVLATWGMAEEARMAASSKEGPCEINASDPSVINQIKALINVLAEHHRGMEGLIHRIEHLRNRVIV